MIAAKPAIRDLALTTNGVMLREHAGALRQAGLHRLTVSLDTLRPDIVIADEQTLRHRTYPASRGRQRVLQNRDIIRMFETLRVSDSFLLQTNLREILFRKPAYLTPDSLGI